ncbi:hypothetical protein GKE82_20800 [Conexibacter sp. W3-3-2]|uniref:hypothetical protein n=1 Tax=Conexibacter sp. W3-3-2 TaxID=2675227 RepID=UPI0012B7547F|nr:hypothetical protein [Conexibacter sp. W3-3-2]MTD46661.1 hypothetical protein [Conexibacter sp. W3-3-2]
MGERDAFGREQDEDPLAAMGWATPPTRERREAAVPAVTASATTLPGMEPGTEREGIPGTHGPPPRSFPERRARQAGTTDAAGPSAGARLVRALVSIGILFALLGGVMSAVVGSITDAIDGPDVTVPRFTAPVPPTPQTPAGPDGEAPVGLERGSMLLRSSFAAAKATMRSGRFGRLKNLSLRPARIDAQFLTGGGRLRNVEFLPGGKVEQVSLGPPGFGGAQTIPVAPINTAAPYRLTVAAANRLGRPTAEVDYVSYYGEDFVGGLVWGVTFRDGTTFQGDSRGRIVRQL